MWNVVPEWSRRWKTLRQNEIAVKTKSDNEK